MRAVVIDNNIIWLSTIKFKKKPALNKIENVQY